MFVHDRRTGETERISVATDGHESPCSSLDPSISADGRYVSFTSGGTEMVPGDPNTRIGVFLYDRVVRELSRVSV